MKSIEILGLIAAMFTTSSFIPQVYKAWREKATKDISLTMYIAFLIGIILWLIYGYFINSISMVIANTVTLVLVLIVIVLKFKYK
ncbi:SemiSWEET transporter [uncultured Maribacter sp.]|uniref:SemiSWEET family sugar transporter n=1 Tax=uncultured Maribacter sp. TaxID=431308 RepID=UPI0026235AC5|nr:SemiSWEET transporter [uncultured Maribacter sp.]